MFIRAFFVLGWGGEQFGAGSSFTPSESYMLQFVGVLSANQSFFSSAHIPKSFFLSWQLFFVFPTQNMHSGRNICLSESSDVFFITPSSAIVYANRSWGGVGRKNNVSAACANFGWNKWVS